MNEEIIDGVNVSECKFLRNCIIRDNYGCKIDDSLCCDVGNCYYKQLKRLQAENKELKEKNKMLSREKLHKLDAEMITEEYINEIIEENKRLSKMTCPKCGEELLNPTGSDLYDEINDLKEQVAVLQSYKDVNEDFQKAWQELKEENDKLQGLYQDEHCMNLELGKIIECKNGTIATLAKTRDKLRAENEQLKEENKEINECMSDVIYRATGGRLCYSTYTLDAIEHAFQDQLEILSDRKTEELEKEYEELKKENTELQENAVELIQLKEEERQLREGWHTQCEVIESLRTENERLNSACLQLQSAECKQYLEKVNCERDNYKFHKALEDIREIINKSCKQCKNEYLSEDYCSGQSDCYEIMEVINEVIGEQE